MSYFTEAELKDLLLQVGRGLRYIHSMSLVHMDIKPSKYYRFSDLCSLGFQRINDFIKTMWKHKHFAMFFHCQFFFFNFLFYTGVQFSRSVLSLCNPMNHSRQLINNFVIVSGGQQRDSAVHIHVSILAQTPLPSRLPHNVEQSSLYCTVGPCWVSVLNTAVCTFHFSFKRFLTHLVVVFHFPSSLPLLPQKI